MSAPTCVAPLDDGGGLHDRLCGRPATTERVVGGIALPLCDDHARELDAERAEEGS